MKRKSLLLLLFIVGIAGLLACGQVPEQFPNPGVPGPAGPLAGDSRLAALPLSPWQAPPAGEVVLLDDFTGPLGETWEVMDIAQTPGERAVWRSAEGVLAQDGTELGLGSVDSAYLVTNQGADWTDYTVRANIYVESNDEVGLIFRVNEAGFYRFRMRSAEFQGPYQVGLDRYQDGRYTVLWHAAGNGYPLRTWFTLQIEVRGDTFVVSVDGRPVATVQDAAFAQGGVGFYAWAEGGAYFDNMVCLLYTSPSPRDS